MTVSLDSRRDFTLANLKRVAVDGEPLVIGKKGEAAMAAARRSFMALLDSDRGQFIYGTTSGAGQNASQRISAAEQRKKAQQGRRVAAGGGFGPELLPERVVRMVIFARLANYIEGNAKTRPVEAQRIASMLTRPLPKVPLSGQVGAGEILPLFHVMNAMPGGDVEEAEPMARVNGSPVSTALLCDVALTAAVRLDLAAQVFALAIEAYQAQLEFVDPALAGFWASPAEKRALKTLKGLLAGVPKAGRMAYQPPVSFRILPRVLGAGYQALMTAEETAAISLAAVTDNPVYVLPDKAHPLGRAISTGGYHNAQATPAIDTLNARFADLCTLADRQTFRLQSADHLPENLAKPGQFSWGTTLLSFVQVGYGEEARHAAARTFLPPSEGGGVGGQNDVAMPITLAYGKHRTAARCLESALAILAASASQALYVTDRKAPRKLRGLLEQVRDILPPVTKRAGRNLGRDLGRLQQRFAVLAGP